MNNEIFRKIIWSSIAILFGISLILIVTFICFFYSQPISSNINDWSSFGSFLSPVIAILNTILLGLITLLISSIQRNKSKFDRRDRIHQELMDIVHEITTLLVEKDITELSKKELDLESLKLTQFISGYSNELRNLNLLEDGKKMTYSMNTAIDNFLKHKKDEIVAEEARSHMWNFLEELVDFEHNFRNEMNNDRYA